MNVKEYIQNLLSGGTANGSGTEQADPKVNGVIKDENTQKTKLQEALDFLKDSGIIKINEKPSEESTTPAKEEKKTVDTSKIVIGGLVAIIVVMLLILILKRK